MGAGELRDIQKTSTMAQDAKLERKLTTIFSADVAGYSGLMERDEAGTMAELRETRRLLSVFIERHRGRVVNTAGDGLLAEFASVVEAVLCAIEIQRELAVRNSPPEATARMQYRIGINLGDVMVENGDLFGEGVNVAARLQGLADPGGIMISGAVHDLVRGKLDVAYDYLGLQEVKNIATAVPVYRIALNGKSQRSGAGLQAESASAAAQDVRPGSADPSQPAAASSGPALAFSVASLVLLASSFIPYLGRTAWPGLVLGYVAGASAVARRLSGRANSSAQIGLVVLLLLGINVLSSSDQWWFIYPGVVLTAIALAICPEGLVRLATRVRR
jgi:adenylate cyclase